MREVLSLYAAAFTEISAAIIASLLFITSIALYKRKLSETT